MLINTLGKILLVDGDENIVELLQVNLSSEGYTVTSCSTAAEAKAIDLSDTSLVIADCMTQSYTGLDLLEDVKSDPMKQHVGFIMCTAHDSEKLLIRSLDGGADDFVVKPFSLRELVARVRSVLRRHNVAAKPAPGKTLSFKTLEVDLVNRRVTDGGVVISLSKTEYAILVMLMKNINNFLTRAEIHRNVWNEATDSANDRIVDTNISRLRKKLGDLGAYIVNRSGFGYILTPEPVK